MGAPAVVGLERGQESEHPITKWLRRQRRPYLVAVTSGAMSGPLSTFALTAALSGMGWWCVKLY